VWNQLSRGIIKTYKSKGSWVDNGIDRLRLSACHVLTLARKFWTSHKNNKGKKSTQAKKSIFEIQFISKYLLYINFSGNYFFSSSTIIYCQFFS
jgi:hypothetical protein